MTHRSDSPTYISARPALLVRGMEPPGSMGLSALLQATTLADVLAAKKKGASRVVSFEHSQTVAEALELLQRHHILAAPLLVYPTLRNTMGEGLADEEETQRPMYLGMLDALDLLSGLISALPLALGKSPSQWALLLDDESPLYLSRHLVTLPGRGDGTLVYSANQGLSLLEVLRDGFLAGVSARHGAASRRVCHRLAVFDDTGAVTDLLSQSDVVGHLANTGVLEGSLGERTISQLNLGHARGGLAAVAPRVPTVEALQFMVSRDVSSVAVVDDAGHLVGNLSASDLRGIAGGALNHLALPVGEFLARRSERHGLVTCAPESSFAAVVRRMAAQRVHRVYVVDDQGKAVGIVTCTDVLQAVLAAA